MNKPRIIESQIRDVEFGENVIVKGERFRVKGFATEVGPKP